MFGLHTHILASIHSYERAADYFEKRNCRRIESKEYHGVSLNPDRHADHVRLIKQGKSYALRYHHTNVVTYHPDGRVTVDLTYASQNTALFADYYLPWGLGARFYKGRVMLTMRGGDYAFRDPVTLREKGGNWHVIEKDRNKIIQFGVTRTNRKVASRAWRDERVVALRQYLQTIAGLGSVTQEVWEAMRGGHDFRYTDDALLAAINDEQHWPVLAAMLMRTSYSAQLGGYGAALPSNYEETLRERAYKLADAYYVEPLPEGTTHPRMQSLS